MCTIRHNWLLYIVQKGSKRGGVWRLILRHARPRNSASTFLAWASLCSWRISKTIAPLRKILLTCGRKHIIEVTNVPIYKGDAMPYTLYHQLLLIQANPIQDFSLGKYLIQHCPIIQLSKVKPPCPLNVYSREPSFRRKMIANPIHFYPPMSPCYEAFNESFGKAPEEHLGQVPSEGVQ